MPDQNGAEKRAAIVTGGATGVGAATALALAQRGYNVAIVYSRSAEEAERKRRGVQGRRRRRDRGAGRRGG